MTATKTRRTRTRKAPAADGKRRCANEACRKPLDGFRKDAKVCSQACRYALKQQKQEDQPDVWICHGCRFPTDQQAEIVMGPRVRRHPFGGKRIHEFSGYCVVPTCECPTCRPENQPQEDDAE